MADLVGMEVPQRVAKALQPGAFVETPTILEMRRWMATTSGLVVLVGTVGSGKSVAAAWVLANNVRTETVELVGGDSVPVTTRLSGRWISASDLGQSMDYDQAFWRGLRRADLLVVDEVGGRERLDQKGRALGNIVELLRRRYDDGRRTVMTTNLTPAEWMGLYGDHDGGRLRDRLREAEQEFGREPFIVVAGVSLRGGRPPAPARTKGGRP